MTGTTWLPRSRLLARSEVGVEGKCQRVLPPGNAVSCPPPLGAGWRSAFPGRISLEDACIGGSSIEGELSEHICRKINWTDDAFTLPRVAAALCPGAAGPRPAATALRLGSGLWREPQALIVRGLNRQSPFAVVRLCSLSILRQAQDIANSRPRTLNELREELCAQWNEVGRGRGEPTDRTLAPHRFPRLHR